jgi:hypothetical protein
MISQGLYGKEGNNAHVLQNSDWAIRAMYSAFCWLAVGVLSGKV